MELTNIQKFQLSKIIEMLEVEPMGEPTEKWGRWIEAVELGRKLAKNNLEGEVFLEYKFGNGYITIEGARFSMEGEENNDWCRLFEIGDGIEIDFCTDEAIVISIVIRKITK